MTKLTSTPFKIKLLSRLWPPFFGANIRVTKITSDFREIQTRMKLSWFNRNWVGTHYGGSVFSMTDPFFMLMLIHLLGSEYTVWDKSAHIEFKRPGKTEMIANFHIPEERIKEILENTKAGSPYFVNFHVDVLDTDNQVVASVDKVIYIKRKQAKEVDVC